MTECTVFDTWHSWVGQRVCIKGNQRGTLQYFGETEFDGIWCGIELDKPLGENDGMVNNVRYFNCEANHGIFVPVLETTKIYNEIDINAACCLTSYSSNMNSDKDASDKKSVFQCANVALNKTFDINVSDVSGKKSSLEEKIAKETIKKFTFHGNSSNEKFRKGFKRSERKHFAVLDSEESLGILSDLLEDDPAYFSPSISELPEPNEIANFISVPNRISESLDSVFLSANSSQYDEPYIYCKNLDSPSQNCVSDVKFTSTPKHSIDTFKLESDVSSRLEPMKLNNLMRGDHSPIKKCHAQSDEMKSEIDFDLSRLNETKVLSSTKTLNVLTEHDKKTSFCYTNTIEKETSNENIPESKHFGSNLDITQIFSKNKGYFMCNNIMRQDIDGLNTTFKIESTSLPKYDAPKLPLNINIATMDNVDGLDFTFIVEDDTIKNNSKCEETFVIDCSSVKIVKRPEVSECLEKQTQIEEEVSSEKALAKTTTHKVMKEYKSSKILGTIDKLPTSHQETVKKTFFRKSVNCFPCKPTCVSKQVNADAFQNLNSTFRLKRINSKPEVNPVLNDFSKRHSLSTVSFANKQNLHKFNPEFKKPLTFSSKTETSNSVPKVQTLSKVKKLHLKASSSFPSENVNATLITCNSNAQVLNETISNSIKKNGKCVKDIFESSICCSKSIPAKENIKCSKSLPSLNLEMKCRSSVRTMKNNVAIQRINELAVNEQKVGIGKTKAVLGTDKVKPVNFSVKRKARDFQTNALSRVSHIGSVNKTASKSLKVNSQNTKTLPQKIKAEDIGKVILPGPISKPRNSPINAITVCTTNSALSIHSDFESVSEGIVELDNKLSKTLILNNSKELSARTCEAPNAQVTKDLENKTCSGIGTSSVFSKIVLQGRKGIPTVKQNGFKKGRTSLLPAPSIIKKSVTISNAVKPQAQLSSEISQDCLSISRKFPTRKLQSPRSYPIRS